MMPLLQANKESNMTATVTVKTRAWPAIVTIKSKTEGAEGHNVDTDDTEVAARTSMDFVVDESLELSVRVIRPEEAQPNTHLPLDPDNVPGREENDALLRPVGEEDPEAADD